MLIYQREFFFLFKFASKMRLLEKNLFQSREKASQKKSTLNPIMSPLRGKRCGKNSLVYISIAFHAKMTKK
jgi:hypothetical protein